LHREEQQHLLQKFERKKAREIARLKEEQYGAENTAAIVKRDMLKEIAAEIQPALPDKATVRYLESPPRPRHLCPTSRHRRLPLKHSFPHSTPPFPHPAGGTSI
jgi:hypothetical protein